jgi:hypothetical protein
MMLSKHKDVAGGIWNAALGMVGGESITPNDTWDGHKIDVEFSCPV